MQQMSIKRMGQMSFISPQMGPSMSPGFAFAVQDQAQSAQAPTPAAMPMAPAPMPAGPPSVVVPPGAVIPPVPAPANGWIAPAAILVGVAVLVGLTA